MKDASRLINSGHVEPGGLSRRVLLERAGLLGLAVALAPLPDVLARKGLLGDALAASDAVTVDTLKGLCAFILPGNDAYSRAQGDKTKEPGAIAAGTVPALIATLDNVIKIEGAQVRVSSGVAALLNDYAVQVDPAAASGTFLSPFARLRNKDKAEVFRRFEADPAWDDNQFKFLSGIVPGLVALLAFSEAGVIDPKTRRVRKRPVGWRLAEYSGPAEGHAELKGYFQKRRRVRGTRA